MFIKGNTPSLIFRKGNTILVTLMYGNTVQHMLHMPKSVLKFQVAAVIYAVHTFIFELGHV